MANDETKTDVGFFGGSVDATDTERLMRAMEDTADEGGRAGDMSYMSFSGKRGVYSIGVNKREPGENEPFLVAVPSFELGYMCWKGGKPISKRMATIMQTRIAEPDPEEFGPFDTNRGEGWSRARAITVRSLKNEEQCYFSTTSASGVASMSDLQREVLSRMKSGQPCWPVIYFDIEEFESQGYKNFKPVFDVTEWVSNEQVQTLADPDVDPMSLLDGEPAEKPKKAEMPEPRKRERRKL